MERKSPPPPLTAKRIAQPDIAAVVTRKRGDQAGRPTSKNLAPAFLTKNATIEQRTSTYQGGVMSTLSDAKSPERAKANPSPRRGGGQDGPRRVGGLPPKANTPSLPSIGTVKSRPGGAAAEEDATPSSRRRSNTHQPSTTTAASVAEVQQRLRGIQKRSSSNPEGQLDENVAKLLEETRIESTKPVGTAAVGKFNAAFKDEDSDYAAFLRRRDGKKPPRPGGGGPASGMPVADVAPPKAAGMLPSVGRRSNATPTAAASTPTASGGRRGGAREGTNATNSRTAPVSRRTAAPAKKSVYGDIRSPRKKLDYDDDEDDNGTNLLPRATSDEHGVEQHDAPLPTLAGEDHDSSLPIVAPPSPGAAPHEAEQSQHTLAPTSATPNESKNKGASRFAPPAALQSTEFAREASSFATAGRYRIDVTEVDFAGSPSAATRKYGTTGSHGTTASSVSPPPEDFDSTSSEVQRQRNERRRQNALRTIALATGTVAPAAHAGGGAAPAALGANAYSGAGYGGAPGADGYGGEAPTTGRSMPTNSYAAPGYGGGDGYAPAGVGSDAVGYADGASDAVLPKRRSAGKVTAAGTDGYTEAGYNHGGYHDDADFNAPPKPTPPVSANERAQSSPRPPPHLAGDGAAAPWGGPPGLLAATDQHLRSPNPFSGTGSPSRLSPQPPTSPNGGAPSGASPHSAHAFRMRQVTGPTTSDSPSPAPSPMPRLSFLQLAEQLLPGGLPSGQTNDDLAGTIKYSVHSPAVASPLQRPGPLLSGTVGSDSAVMDEGALTLGDTVSAPSAAVTLPRVISGTSDDLGSSGAQPSAAFAAGAEGEDAELNYLSAAAATAEAEYWRQLRDGTTSALSGYAAGGAASVTSPSGGLAVRRRLPSQTFDLDASSNGMTTVTSSPNLGGHRKSTVGGANSSRTRRVGIDSMRRSTVDAAACHRPWNDSFQALLERPCATALERAERGKCMRRLCSMFRDAMSPVIESIVLERGIPDEERIVKLQNVGGVAGGDKYAIGNIFLKYCGSTKAVSSRLYGDHIWALKSATNELKGLNALIRAGVPHLHVPLGMTATFLGQRLWVCSRLPIDGARTLRFGSQDAGATVRTDDAESRIMAAKAAGILNLKTHRCGSAVIPTPVDLEIHHGDDGRYYVVDTARLFPPDANPLSGRPRNYHLHKNLRPERVHDNTEAALSSDALCQLGRRDPEYALHDREVVEAGMTITTTCVPMLARQLGRLFLEEGESRIAAATGGGAGRGGPRGQAGSDPHGVSLTGALLRNPCNAVLKRSAHDYGVNLRYLGRLLDEFLGWAAHASQPVPVSVVCTHIVAEIIARSFKSVVNVQLNNFGNAARERQAEQNPDAVHPGGKTALSADDISSYHHLVVELYERLLHGGAESRYFWALALMPMIMRKFKCSADTLEALFACHSRGSIDKPWIAANHLHALIFVRCNELLGVTWHVDRDRDHEFVARLGAGAATAAGKSTNSSTTTGSIGGGSSHVFSLPLLEALRPVVKVCDISPFATVAELVQREDFARAEQLYLDEVEIRAIAVGETPALAPLLANLAELYARWPGHEEEELNLRRRIVLLFQRAWEATIAANPTDFEAFFSDANGDTDLDPEELVRSIPSADLARASSNTVLLPLTPPYVDALNGLGACLLKLQQPEEAVEALQTAARMAAARLAVAAYANPSTVVAEQIKHDEQRLTQERRGLNNAAQARVDAVERLLSADPPARRPRRDTQDDGSAAAATNDDDAAADDGPDDFETLGEASITMGVSLVAEAAPGSGPDEAPTIATSSLQPVERAALEAELEMHAVQTRRLLGDGYTRLGSLPDALVERHSCIMMTRRACARRSEQVMALASSVVAHNVPSRSLSTLTAATARQSPSMGGTITLSAASPAGSPRPADIALRAMLAEVGVPGGGGRGGGNRSSATWELQQGGGDDDGADGSVAGNTAAALSLYLRALRDLSRTLSLCGRGKFACGVADEVLRVVLAPQSSVRSATSGGPGDRPESASPMHQPAVLEWFQRVLRKAAKGTRGAELAETVVLGSANERSAASTVVAALFASAPDGEPPTKASPRGPGRGSTDFKHGGDASASSSHGAPDPTADAAKQRAAAFALAQRELVEEDLELIEGLVDIRTGDVLRPLDASVTAYEAAIAFLAAAEARIEDWAFIGDGSAALAAALEALKIVLGHAADAMRQHAPGSPTAKSTAASESPLSPFRDDQACRAALTVARLLMRVGAHREGQRLLHRAYAAARSVVEDMRQRGRPRHEAVFVAAECAMYLAESTLLPGIEIESFLPVPDTAKPPDHEHAAPSGSHDLGGGGASAASTTTTSFVSALTAAASGGAISLGRVIECQRYLETALEWVADATGRQDGIICSRLTALLSACALLDRQQCSLVPSFTAPPYNPAILTAPLSVMPNGQRDDIVQTRFQHAVPGMSKFSNAVTGLAKVKQTAAVALMGLSRSGDSCSSYFNLALCVSGVANLVPFTDAVALQEILAKEVRAAGIRRASQGRSAPSTAITEAPSVANVALMLYSLHGVLPPDDVDEPSSPSRAPSRILSPTRSPTPGVDGSGTTQEPGWARLLRRTLSESFDQFFRALATSDEHMSRDMLDYLSRRCVNHATLLEQRSGVSHNSVSKRVQSNMQLGGGQQHKGAGGKGDTGGASTTSSAVPLSRGCQKRRLQALLALAPTQLQHGDTASGISVCKAALALFRDLFPYRMPWDPLEDSLLVSLRSLGSWLIRTQPMGADRDLGSTLLRIVDRELDKKATFIKTQVASAAKGAAEQEREAFAARQQRLTAQLQQLTFFGRLSRVDNMHCLLLHALDDFAILYPDGAARIVPHSVQSHNDLVQQIRTVMRITHVPPSVLDKAIRAHKNLQAPSEPPSNAESASQSIAPSGMATPRSRFGAGTAVSSPAQPGLKPPLRRASGAPAAGGGQPPVPAAPAWQTFAKSARDEQVFLGGGPASGRGAGILGRAGSFGGPTGASAMIAASGGGKSEAVLDAEALAHSIFRFEALVHHALCTLHVVTPLGPNFDRHSAEVTDAARRQRRHLEGFSMGN